MRDRIVPPMVTLRIARERRRVVVCWGRGNGGDGWVGAGFVGSELRFFSGLDGVSDGGEMRKVVKSGSMPDDEVGGTDIPYIRAEAVRFKRL